MGREIRLRLSLFDPQIPVACRLTFQRTLRILKPLDKYELQHLPILTVQEPPGQLPHSLEECLLLALLLRLLLALLGLGLGH